MIIRQILAHTNEFTQPYLLSASQYIKSLKLGKKHPVTHTQILLLKSLTAALLKQGSTSTSLELSDIETEVCQQKLAKIVEQSLAEFALDANGSSTGSLTEETLRFLSMLLEAAHILDSNGACRVKVVMSGDTLTRLERAGNVLESKDAAIAWKLRSFLMKQSVDRYTTESFSAILDESGQGVEEEWIRGFVDSYIQGKSQSARDQLLDELIGRDELIRGSIGPLIATRKLLEVHQGMYILHLW